MSITNINCSYNGGDGNYMFMVMFIFIDND